MTRNLYTDEPRSWVTLLTRMLDEPRLSEIRGIVSKAVKRQLDRDTVIFYGLSVDKGDPEQVLLRIFSGQLGCVSDMEDII